MRYQVLAAESDELDEFDEETRVKEREEHPRQVEREAVGIFITENGFFKSCKYHNTIARLMLLETKSTSRRRLKPPITPHIVLTSVGNSNPNCLRSC